MRRLHLVGKSKDGKRLTLSNTRGARFGSYEVAVSPKLLRIIREIDEGGEKKKPQARKDEARPKRDRRRGPASRLGPGVVGRPPPTVQDRPPESEKVPEAGRVRAEAPKETPSPKQRKEPYRETAGPTGVPDSQLTPAEIQTLLRKGRSVRAVARVAEVPSAWVRRLAEPIEQERVGAVNLMLQQPLVRARLGISSEPLGIAIVMNLRDRAVPFPERIIEEGFDAKRTDDGLWHVSLSYEFRGRHVARWSFDPDTRQVKALNTTGAQLGWRAPDGGTGTARPRPAVTRPQRRARKKRASKDQSRKKPPRKKPSGKTRKKPPRKKPSGKSRKKPAGKKPSRRKKRRSA